MFALLFLTSAVLQGSPIVADINTDPIPTSSAPASLQGVGAPEAPLTSFGGSFYYRAFDPDHGVELWRSAGSTASTGLVADLRPGPLPSTPMRAVPLGGELLFVATAASGAAEWHKTDGVTTSVVTPIAPPGLSASIGSEVLQGGHVLFTASDGATGIELWRTDGTAAGTQQVLDIVPGPQSGFDTSTPELFVATSGIAYFSADAGAAGQELWRSDGTAAGTFVVADIYAGAGSSRPSRFMEYGGHVYFWARIAGTGNELWRTDGTAAGTALVAELQPGLQSSMPLEAASIVFAGELYFAARTSAEGTELWRTDGTTTALVADANPGPADFAPRSLAFLNGSVYCAGTTAATGDELFRFDASGVSLVSDTHPGAADGVVVGPVAAGGRLHMTVATAATGAEPWISDGTLGGTQLLLDLMPGAEGSDVAHVTEAGPGIVVFVANAPLSGRELWFSAGTAGTTLLLVDSTPEVGSPGSTPEELVSPDGLGLVFRADDGVHGVEPWAFVPGGAPVLLADTVVGGSGVPHDFTPVWTGAGVQTFFLAYDGPDSRQLWATDGTPEGTLRITGFVDDPLDQDLWLLWPVGDRLYFYADVPNGGVELLVSDGTVLGTQVVASLPNADQVQSGFEADGVIYLGLDDGVVGNELWSFDTQTGVLALVKDLRPGPSSGAPVDFAAFQGEVWFSADDGVHGRELWRTDGTTAGTLRVTDLWAGFNGSLPTNLIALEDKLFFMAQDGTPVGLEMYVHDPVAGTTALVVDLSQSAPFTQLSTARCQVGDDLYLAILSDLGSELHRLRANPPSLVQVEDLNPGVQSGALSAQLVRAGTGFYYGGSDGIAGGHELRFFDATTETSVKVFDAAPSGGPTELVLAAGRLYFDYADPLVGDELGAVDTAEAYALPLLPSASPATLEVDPPRLGTSVGLRAAGLPVPSAGVLLMSPLSAPVALAPVVTDGQPLWVAAATAQVLSLVPTAPTWTGSYTLPATPGLAGVRVHLQLLALPDFILPAVTTNGVQAVLGS